ncbi:MAG: sugar transferase [Bacteroidetes bacterium]|nr:MAG: sugar transferase [Bacteroidota bacterium]
MITINQVELKSFIEEGEITFRSYIDKKTFFFFLKRASDIIFSVTIIILLLSWIIPLMAIVIKLNSRGPVFFIQRRVGRGLRSFGCIKFRTMVLNYDADRCSACNDDQRVTSVGKFLRKTSLDELPQFINVLLGDMSIIGPRPHMFADCNRFSTYIQDYKFRSLVRPGITGLAQVKGFRGPAEDSYNIVTRFYYDSIYIQKMNFQLDINILINTISQVFTLILFKSNIERGKAKDINADSKIAA